MTGVTTSVRTGSTSWFGKLPTKGDFVRGGLHGPAELALEAWLALAVEHSEGRVSAEPVHFMVRCVDANRLVGTWIASRDAAGRCFPLAVMLRVPADVEAAQWSLLTTFYDPFLHDAAQALQGCVDQRLESLSLTLQQISPPHESVLPHLRARAQYTLREMRVEELSQRSFQLPALEAMPYALSSLRQGLMLEQSDLTLDIPSVEPTDMVVWLELVRVLGASEQMPDCFVWVPSARRLLLCLEVLPIELLGYLMTTDHRSSRRWPLATTSQAARAIALAELAPTVRQALEANVSLAALIELLESRVP